MASFGPAPSSPRRRRTLLRCWTSLLLLRQRFRPRSRRHRSGLVGRPWVQVRPLGGGFPSDGSSAAAFGRVRQRERREGGGGERVEVVQAAGDGSSAAVGWWLLPGCSAAPEGSSASVWPGRH